jgi:hypothetical protein
LLVNLTSDPILLKFKPYCIAICKTIQYKILTKIIKLIILSLAYFKNQIQNFLWILFMMENKKNLLNHAIIMELKRILATIMKIYKIIKLL